MIFRSVAIGVALALSLGTAVQAEMDYAHEGIYVQLSGSLGVLSGGSSGTSRFGEGVSGGFSAKLGIDIMDHVALEVQFEALPGDDLYVATFQQRTRILTGRWQPFLIWGIGYGNVDAVSSFSLRLGGGLDFMITENVSVVADLGYVFLVNKDAYGEGFGPGYGSFGLGVRYGF